MRPRGLAVSMRVNAVANADATLCEPVVADESSNAVPDDEDMPDRLSLL